MRSSKFLPALRSLKSRRASLGERTMSTLLPSRAYGFGSWGQANQVEQVQHLKHWCFVFIDLICSKLASITPNMAYVTDQPGTGKKTVKAGQRGLRNLSGRGFGGSYYTGGSYSPEHKGIITGTYVGTDGWSPRERVPDGVSFSDGGHSFLTMGEYRSKALSVVQPHEELEPLESDHPLRRLIGNPNPYDTCYDYTYEKWLFLLLTGVGYEWLVPNEYRTMPGERWVIPSHWVWPRTGGRRPREVELRDAGWNGHRDEGSQYLNPYNLPDAATGQGSQHLVDYYEVRPWGGMGSAGILKFPPEEIVMTRFKSPLDKIAGWSPLAAMAQWIDNEESITKCQWGQFANQARPELWIELGPGYEDPTDDRIGRYEAKMLSKFQGEFNTGRPIFTPPGSKVSVLSFNPAEMAYQASGDQVRDMLGSGFRVPKSAVGISNDMTYGSILATLSALCVYCLNPKLALSGQTDTKHLASRWDETTPAYSTLTGKGYGSAAGGRKVKLWYDDCVPADPDQVNKDLACDATFYAVTPNEVRALRGRKPYELGGDNPVGQGAGGPTPLALNVEEDVGEMAKIVAQLTEAQGKSPGETAEGQPEPGKEGEEEQRPEGGADAPANDLPAPADMAEDAAGIAVPNGKPSKSLSLLWTIVASNGTEYPIAYRTREEAQKRADELNQRNSRRTGWVVRPPPNGKPTKNVKQWDAWFKSVGLEKNWQTVKSRFPDEKHQLNWATLMELNRISRAVKKSLLPTAYPDLRQDNHWRCGAAEWAGAMTYLGQPTTVDEASDTLGTNVEHSTDPYQMVEAFRAAGVNATAKSGLSVADLKRETDLGHPVIVCLQDYGDRRESGASFAYGHYVTVLEVTDSGLLVCHDPSLENVEREPGGDVPPSRAERTESTSAPGLVVFKEDEFLKVWHDETASGKKLVRFGIVVGSTLPDDEDDDEPDWEDQGEWPEEHDLGGEAKAVDKSGPEITDYKKGERFEIFGEVFEVVRVNKKDRTLDAQTLHRDVVNDRDFLLGGRTFHIRDIRIAKPFDKQRWEDKYGKAAAESTAALYAEYRKQLETALTFPQENGNGKAVSK